jgi:hypothetical protein
MQEDIKKFADCDFGELDRIIKHFGFIKGDIMQNYPLTAELEKILGKGIDHLCTTIFQRMKHIQNWSKCR